METKQQYCVTTYHQTYKAKLTESQGIRSLERESVSFAWGNALSVGENFSLKSR
jgi:hypothetical protein